MKLSTIEMIENRIWMLERNKDKIEEMKEILAKIDDASGGLRNLLIMLHDNEIDFLTRLLEYAEEDQKENKKLRVELKKKK